MRRVPSARVWIRSPDLTRDESDSSDEDNDTNDYGNVIKAAIGAGQKTRDRIESEIARMKTNIKLQRLKFLEESGRTDSQQRMVAHAAELAGLNAEAERAQTNEERSRLLFRAIKAGGLDLVKLLLNRGCALDQTDENQATPLHCAAAGGFLDAARLLVNKGCSLAPRDMNGTTPLHWAASRGDSQLARFLLKQGTDDERVCPVDAKDNNGRTPLHLAASKGHLRLIRMLLDRGTTVDVRDNRGQTPLHAAARDGQVEVAEILLERGSPVDARDSEGFTPFHSAVAHGEVEVAQFLLDRGYHIQDEMDDGSRMKLAVRSLVQTLKAQTQNRSDTDQRRSRERVLSIVFLLVRNGCSCDLARSAAQEEQTPDIKLVLAAIDGWEVQQKLSIEVSSIPAEVLGGTVQDLHFFFKSMQRAGSSYRKKLCVVGPSSWGKTSFINSLTSNRSNLEHADTRTIGIDMFSWSFDMTGRSGRCEVSIWDFAGQDEYQSAHAMFYSKRTLYVVCVNMAAYVDMLESNNIRQNGERNVAFDAFFDAMIYNRIRAICAHEPASDFVFVGTKLDLVADKERWVERVTGDIQARVNHRDEEEMYELGCALEEIETGQQGTSSSLSLGAETSSRYQHLMHLRRERPRYLCEGLLAMSSADLSGLTLVRKELQECIETSDSSFLMPWNLAMVSQTLRKMVQQAKDAGSIASKVAKVFVPKDKLCQLIQKECPQAELDSEEVESILRMLHALGDILWFEKSDGRLSNTVFLSPDLVIDFIRKVINHELGNATSSTERSADELAVRNEGKVAHKLLEQLDLWSAVTDRNVMMQLKRLLLNFELAYPEGSNTLRWDSDLIVPTYWKRAKRRDSLAAGRIIPPALNHTVAWEYEFRIGLPCSLFEKLVVRSFSSYVSCQRTFTQTSFATSRPSEYITEVAKVTGGGDGSSYPTLRIRVFAVSTAIAWKQWLWYVVCLERLLEEYPGLWVVRYAVSADGTRFEVDQLLRERRERNQLRGITDFEQDLATSGDLLPPIMTWFVNKEWNAPEKNWADQPAADVHEKETNQESLRNALERFYDVMMHRFDVVDAKQIALQQTTIESSAEHSDYPGLWTLAHRGNAIVSEYELALLSQLSGKCYHKPIIVKVPNPDIFGKYGEKLTMGISLIAACIPDMLGKGLVELGASALINQIERAKTVRDTVSKHNSLGVHENADLSPDQNVRILKELLKLKFHDFEPLMVPEIANLVCGFWADTGMSIWAHKDEISTMGGAIILRNAGAVGPIHTQLEGLDTITVPSLPTGSLGSLNTANGTMTPVVAPRELDATLEILSAEGLPIVRKIGAQSPYCKWKLVNSNHKVMAQGRTLKHARGGSKAEWKYASVLQADSVLKTLAGCTLIFVVKTETTISSDVICEGSHKFSEKELELPCAGQRYEFEVGLSSSGNFAGTLKIRLRF